MGCELTNLVPFCPNVAPCWWLSGLWGCRTEPEPSPVIFVPPPPPPLPALPPERAETEDPTAWLTLPTPKARAWTGAEEPAEPVAEAPPVAAPSASARPSVHYSVLAYRVPRLCPALTATKQSLG